MKSLSLASLSLVGLIAIFSSSSEASSADRNHWIGATNNSARIEFLRTGSSNNWQLVINGASRESLSQVRSNQDRTILKSRRGQLYEVLRTETHMWSNGGKFATYRGGWNEGGLKGVRIVPFGYNYVGLGNRGGVSINEFDRAAQRHDIGYETQPMKQADGRTDARFVFDSARAAVNPRNGMGIGHRAYSAGGALLFAGKPGVYHTKKVFGKRIPVPNTGLANIPLYAGEQGWNRAVKPGAKWT